MVGGVGAVVVGQLLDGELLALELVHVLDLLGGGHLGGGIGIHFINPFYPLLRFRN